MPMALCLCLWGSQILGPPSYGAYAYGPMPMPMGFPRSRALHITKLCLWPYAYGYAYAYMPMASHWVCTVQNSDVFVDFNVGNVKI